MRRQASGFTLIELMIVVAIVAILAAIALPAYNEQVHKGRRSDAMSAAGQIQMDMERWRADHPTYTAVATPTSNFYAYDIDVSADGLGYTLTASPKGSQSGDRCGDLTATQDIRAKPQWATAACN
jgi:type IV pilus assembly protein PilE